MNTIELELQKANLARKILTTSNENLINNILLIVKKYNYDVPPLKEISKKREIGFLKGKAEVIFQNDWSMTPEELGMV